MLSNTIREIQENAEFFQFGVTKRSPFGTDKGGALLSNDCFFLVTQTVFDVPKGASMGGNGGYSSVAGGLWGC